MFHIFDLRISLDQIPEKGKVLSTDDWSKSWKISFELKVNANPAAHQNILEVSGLMSLYVAPWEALDVHFNGGIYGSFPLTMGTFQRLEVQQFLVRDQVR